MPQCHHQERLDSADAIAFHLDGLVARDARLAAVREIAGPVMPRVRNRGFEGMAHIICAQQLSVASAGAIWNRFAAIEGSCSAQGYLGLDEGAARAAGMSAGKCRTLRVVAEAIVNGALDLDAVETMPVTQAIDHMTQLRGIGPWTAEIYLLFCAGHPDIFPAGDLALQKAAAHGLGLEARPDAATLAGIANQWSPHRGVAALLFWRYFAAIREKEGIAL
ncbi:MAG TPA: DNA-3-methyladenine glycosylase 2 family protein [Devosiaceae bacterium]